MQSGSHDLSCFNFDVDEETPVAPKSQLTSKPPKVSREAKRLAKKERDDCAREERLATQERALAAEDGCLCGTGHIAIYPGQPHTLQADACLAGQSLLGNVRQAFTH